MSHRNGYVMQPTDQAFQRRQPWALNSQYAPSQQHRHSSGGHLSASIARYQSHISEPRGPSVASSQHRMEVDESSDISSDVLPLTKTSELFSSLQSLPSLVADAHKEIEDLKESASSKSSGFIASLKAELEKNKQEKQQLEARCEQLSTNTSDTDKINRLEEEVRKVKASKEQYEQMYTDMAIQCEKENDRVKELETEKRQLNINTDAMSCELESVKKMLSRKQELFESTLKEKTKIESELSETKSRLSRLMGSKLSNNNPDIADLSDKNRPTKLAERYSELYDNQWTDAFEAFENRLHDEKRSIETLVQMMKDIRMYCDKLTKDQVNRLQEVVTLKRSRNTRLQDDVLKQLKDFRKATADASLPEVYKQCHDVVKHKKYATFLEDTQVQPFFKECVELCWLMSAQDPPVAFGEAPVRETEFDTEVYRHYTKTGKYVAFEVWPALYLHKDGPLLSKGVAQGYEKKDNMSTKQSVKETPWSDMTTPDNDRHVEREEQDRGHYFYQRDNSEHQPYRRNEISSSALERRNALNKNYEQSIVRGSDVSPGTSKGTTTEYGSKTVAERIHKNISGSHRLEAYSVPVRPNSELWYAFKNLADLYGVGSPDVKARFGQDYDICAKYYAYLFRK